MRFMVAALDLNRTRMKKKKQKRKKRRRKQRQKRWKVTKRNRPLTKLLKALLQLTQCEHKMTTLLLAII